MLFVICTFLGDVILRPSATAWWCSCHCLFPPSRLCTWSKFNVTVPPKQHDCVLRYYYTILDRFGRSWSVDLKTRSFLRFWPILLTFVSRIMYYSKEKLSAFFVSHMHVPIVCLKYCRLGIHTILVGACSWCDSGSETSKVYETINVNNQLLFTCSVCS